MVKETLQCGGRELIPLLEEMTEKYKMAGEE